MKTFIKIISWPFKIIVKFFAHLILGIAELFGYKNPPRLKVYFANRNILRKNATLIAIGQGKYERGTEVDFIVKNSRSGKITHPAIVVLDRGKFGVNIIVEGEGTTRFVDRSKIKRVTVIRKSKIAS
jgi:hypothetical protein